LLAEITDIAKKEGFLSKDFVPPKASPPVSVDSLTHAEVGEAAKNSPGAKSE